MAASSASARSVRLPARIHSRPLQVTLVTSAESRSAPVRSHVPAAGSRRTLLSKANSAASGSGKSESFGPSQAAVAEGTRTGTPGDAAPSSGPLVAQQFVPPPPEHRQQMMHLIMNILRLRKDQGRRDRSAAMLPGPPTESHEVGFTVLVIRSMRKS